MSLYGPGVSPDSVGYIQIAEYIKSDGLRFLRENRAVIQPAFYPFILAAVSIFTGFSLLSSAMWINVFCACMVLLFMILSVWQITDSILLLLFAGVLSCFSFPLIHIYSMAWSEPLFILFSTFSLFIVSKNPSSLYSIFFAGLFTSLACLTRYAGIVLLSVIIIFLFVRGEGNIWRRSLYAIVYILPSLIFCGSYIVRNYIVSRTFTGERALTIFTFSYNLHRIIKVIASWFLPWCLKEFEFLLVAIFGPFICIGLWYSRRYILDAIKSSTSMVFLSFLFIVGYISFIVVFCSLKAFDIIDHRLLSPVYPCLIIFFVSLLGESSKGIFKSVGLFLLCLCTIFSSITVCLDIKEKIKDGAGEYNTVKWHKSELIGYLKDTRLDMNERIFSNAHDALYFLAGINARLPPAYRYHNSSAETGVTLDNITLKFPELDGSILVWFDLPGWRSYLFSPEDLKKVYVLEEVKTFLDGKIYRIKKKKDY